MSAKAEEIKRNRHRLCGRIFPFLDGYDREWPSGNHSVILGLYLNAPERCLVMNNSTLNSPTFSLVFQ